jgi:hypothetical protein
MEKIVYVNTTLPGNMDVDVQSNETTQNKSNVTMDNTLVTIQMIVKFSYTYLLPFIIGMGIIGNIMSFVVFTFSRLKRMSTSVYLAALALSDTGFLFCVVIGMVDSRLELSILNNTGICEFVVYLTYVFSFTSVWYVNAFTTELYIAVCYSSKVARICTRAFARKATIGLTVFALLFYTFAFKTAQVMEMGGQKMCVPYVDNKETLIAVSVLDTILTLIVPFTMIIVMTARIMADITGVYRSNMNTDSNASTGSDHDMAAESAAAQVSPNDESLNRQANRAQTKITRMLVVVVLVFLLLNLPIHITRLQSFIRSLIQTDYYPAQSEVVCQQIFQIPFYINFAVNFILYSACGKTFRSAMINLHCCRCRCSCMQNCLSHIGFRRETPNLDRLDNNHSRLVDIHLSAIRHDLPSMDSDFVCPSPPCFIREETSDQLL